MTKAAQARFNMVEQQVRPWEVLDPRVLELMENTPREAFVPEDYIDLAYADTEIPLGDGEEMLAPKIVGRMLQALDIGEHDIALEIGSGSGYFTALLAKSCRQVYSVEIHQVLSQQAQKNLAAQNINNVELETGDAAQGWAKHAPYDVIAITGSMPVLPDTFQQSLQRGGRLVAIVGDAPIMQVILIQRTGDNEWSRETLFETEIKPLQHATQPQRFTF